MSTHTRLMTADEFLKLPDDSMGHELVRGELTTMPLPGGEHGRVAGKLMRRVGGFVEDHNLGQSFAAETGYLLERDPDTVRGCDYGFIRQERLAQVTDWTKHIPFAPDLAVEVISPSDRPGEIAEKTAEWLAAGARMVWNVYPRTRSVRVHRPGAEMVELAEEDVLDAGEVLPGFRCIVGELFG